MARAVYYVITQLTEDIRGFTHDFVVIWVQQNTSIDYRCVIRLLKGVSMAGFDLGEGVRKIFLAGVGAVATGAEKSQQIIEDLVKKGELTVEQGKTLNEELTRKAAKAANDTQDSFLRTRLAGMTPEERAAYVKKVADIATDIDEKATTVEAEVEVVDEAADDAKDGDQEAAEE